MTVLRYNYYPSIRSLSLYLSHALNLQYIAWSGPPEYNLYLQHLEMRPHIPFHQFCGRNKTEFISVSAGYIKE